MSAPAVETVTPRGRAEVTGAADGEPMPARMHLAQYDPTPVSAELVYRSGWARAVRVLVVLAVLPAASVVAFLVPPHGEPLFVVVGVGLYLLWREASTQFIVRSFEGSCPRCRGALQLKRGSRLSAARRVACYGCHFHPVLVFGELDADW